MDLSLEFLFFFFFPRRIEGLLGKKVKFLVRAALPINFFIRNRNRNRNRNQNRDCSTGFGRFLFLLHTLAAGSSRTRIVPLKIFFKYQFPRSASRRLGTADIFFFKFKILIPITTSYPDLKVASAICIEIYKSINSEPSLPYTHPKPITETFTNIKV